METTRPPDVFERTDTGWIACNGHAKTLPDPADVRMVLLRDGARQIILLYHRKYWDASMALSGLYAFTLDRTAFIACAGRTAHGEIVLGSRPCTREFGHDAPKDKNERELVRLLLSDTVRRKLAPAA